MHSAAQSLFFFSRPLLPHGVSSARSRLYVTYLAQQCVTYASICVMRAAASCAAVANRWNHFGMRPSQRVILETAANFTGMGLRDAGYLFINTDDGWLNRQRTAASDLHPMQAQFPRGIAPLTAQLHSMGFRFGM
eukprot:COSAG01_NODE_5699_length_4090_cov_3.098472_2_plen_135_part_00